MTKQFCVSLPWPPTLNTNVRHGGGRHYSTAKYKAWQKEAWYCCRFLPKLGTAPIKLTIHATPPDKRKRDLSNIIKPIEDILQAVGVFDDDFQIADLRIMRFVGQPGVVHIFIEELPTSSMRP